MRGNGLCLREVKKHTGVYISMRTVGEVALIMDGELEMGGFI